VFSRRHNRERRSTSLRWRLRWSYALISAVPLLLMGLLLLNNSFFARRESVYADQQTSALWVGREIAREVSEVEQQLLLFGQRLSLESDDDELLGAVQLLLRDATRIRELAVLDAEGRERVRVSRLLAFYPSDLIDRSDEPLVREALGGTLARSPILPAEDRTPVYTVHVPLYSGPSVVGALRAEVDATFMELALAETPLKESSYAYLVDRDGVLMLSGKPGYVPMFGGYLRNLIKGSPEVQQYQDGNGTPVIGARVRAAPTTWWVIVETPLRAAFAPIWQGIALLGGLSVMVIAAALLWGLVQSRRIIRPILGLRAGARTIGEGDLSYRIAVGSRDEIGELAEEFNRMAEHLQQSRAAIEQQNERLRHGLALARDIQTGLLPDKAPWNLEQIAVHAVSLPAYEVGGDFYSYVALGENQVAVAIGDISGKGVGAALVMALTSSAMEAQAREVERPSQVLTALNTQLAPRLRANHMNAALLHAVIDLAEHRLTVANAGMIVPLILRDGQAIYVESYGLPLGSLVEARYSDVTTPIEPGDTIVLVSDGVVEARNPAGELFGFERLEQLLAQTLGLNRPEQIVEYVMDEVHSFMDGAEQHDDMTLIAIQPNLLPLAESQAAHWQAMSGER
jgi:serine phosphatase RsbU (regulator of sigma subunit)